MGKNLKVGIMALMIAVVFAAAPALAQDKLVIWWNKSFVPPAGRRLQGDRPEMGEEDREAGGPLVSSPCPTTPPRCSPLSTPRSCRMWISARLSPCRTATFAYEDKLLEISDVINPIRSRFTDGALRSQPST